MLSNMSRNTINLRNILKDFFSLFAFSNTLMNFLNHRNLETISRSIPTLYFIITPLIDIICKVFKFGITFTDK